MVSTIGFLSAQEGNTIYVIFTSTRNDSTDDSAGIRYSIHDSESYKSPSYIYFVRDKVKDYNFIFVYADWRNNPDDLIISKPESFLETVDYIDWDVIGPTLTKEQAKEKYQEIIFHSKVYFIDRNDIQNGIMKMVPVYSSIFGNDASMVQTGTAYVVFTNTGNALDTSGFNYSLDKYHSPSPLKYQSLTYTVFNKEKGFHFRFMHMNRIDKPDEPILLKPASFLETVTYIDWDALAPTLTKESAQALYRRLLYKEKIYFIDRKDIQNDVMKVVPVEVLIITGV